MTRKLTCLLLTAILLTLPGRPLSSAPSTAPASEAQLITLTEAELTEILVQAIDEATAPILARLAEEEKARRKAEGSLARLKEAAPWITAGVFVLLGGSFLGGFMVGAR